MTDRFVLEEEIMECWGVVDTMKLLLSDEFQNSTEDVKMNVIVGVIDLYDLKFQKLQATMEHLIAEKKLT